MSKWEGGGGRRGKGKGFGKRGFPFAFFLLLSISLFAPATEACGYHSSDINIQRPVLLSSSSSDVDFFAWYNNLHLIYRCPTFIVVSALSDITRNFSDDDGHVNEDVEKAIGLLSKTATQRACATGTPFLYISFQSPHNCFTGRFMEDINAHKLKFGTQRIPGKNLPTFEISCKQFKIIATNFRKTRWLFNSDVFAVVAAVVAKAPNHQNCERRKNFRNIYFVWTRQQRSGYAMCFRSFLQKRKTIKYASRRSVFESFSPTYS